jgi:hypothetical protein
LQLTVTYSGADIEECHMDANHLKDCRNQSTTEADSRLFMEVLDKVAVGLHIAGVPVSVDVDSRVRVRAQDSMMA